MIQEAKSEAQREQDKKLAEVKEASTDVLLDPQDAYSYLSVLLSSACQCFAYITPKELNC